MHFTPDRGWFSDSFLVENAAGLSQAAALLETVAAVALGLAGASALRHQGGFDTTVRHPTGPSGLRSAWRSPLLILMVVGNLVIFVGSLATR